MTAPHPVTVHVADWADPAGVELRAAQRIDIDSRYGADTEPGVKPTAADITVFLIARAAGGRAIGCGALRRLDDGAAEIKRMFVHADARGLGVGRLLLAELERHALWNGWPVLRLETGPRQPEAVGLYESAGYRRIPSFGHYEGSAESLCYERVLPLPSSP